MSLQVQPTPGPCIVSSSTPWHVRCCVKPTAAAAVLAAFSFPLIFASWTAKLAAEVTPRSEEEPCDLCVSMDYVRRNVPGRREPPKAHV